MRKISFLVRHNRADLSLLHISSQQAQSQKKKKSNKIKEKERRPVQLATLKSLSGDWKYWVAKEKIGGWEDPDPFSVTSGFHNSKPQHQFRNWGWTEENIRGSNPTACICRQPQWRSFFMNQATSADCGLLPHCSCWNVLLLSLYIFSVLHGPFFDHTTVLTFGPPCLLQNCKMSLSRQKELGEGGILTALLAPHFTLQSQAQAFPFPWQRYIISYVLIFSSVGPSQLLISLQLSAPPSLSLSSGHGHGAVVSPCKTCESFTGPIDSQLIIILSFFKFLPTAVV